MHTKSEVLNGTTFLLLEPEGHRIRPTLAHTTGLGVGEAASGTSTSHAVRDSVGHFMRNDIVFEVTITPGV